MFSRNRLNFNQGPEENTENVYPDPGPCINMFNEKKDRIGDFIFISRTKLIIFQIKFTMGNEPFNQPDGIIF